MLSHLSKKKSGKKIDNEDGKKNNESKNYKKKKLTFMDLTLMQDFVTEYGELNFGEETKKYASYDIRISKKVWNHHYRQFIVRIIMNSGVWKGRKIGFSVTYNNTGYSLWAIRKNHSSNLQPECECLNPKILHPQIGGNGRVFFGIQVYQRGIFENYEYRVHDGIRDFVHRLIEMFITPDFDVKMDPWKKRSKWISLFSNPKSKTSLRIMEERQNFLNVAMNNFVDYEEEQFLRESVKAEPYWFEYGTGIGVEEDEGDDFVKMKFGDRKKEDGIKDVVERICFLRDCVNDNIDDGYSDNFNIIFSNGERILCSRTLLYST